MKTTKTISLSVKLEITADDGDCEAVTVSYDASVGDLHDPNKILWSAGEGFNSASDAFNAAFTEYLVQEKLKTL